MLLTIDQSLDKKGSDFRNWPRSVDRVILSNSCPKCGSDVLCVYADMSSTDFCDTYNHICMDSKCDFIERKDIFGISMGGREEHGPSPCPFCERNV